MDTLGVNHTDTPQTGFQSFPMTVAAHSHCEMEKYIALGGQSDQYTEVFSWQDLATVNARGSN